MMNKKEKEELTSISNVTSDVLGREIDEMERTIRVEILRQSPLKRASLVMVFFDIFLILKGTKELS